MMNGSKIVKKWIYSVYICTLGRSKVEEGEEKSNFHNPAILCPAPGHTICTTAEAIQSVTVSLWREQRARMSASHIHRAAHNTVKAYRMCGYSYSIIVENGFG